MRVSTLQQALSSNLRFHFLNKTIAMWHLSMTSKISIGMLACHICSNPEYVMCVLVNASNYHRPVCLTNFFPVLLSRALDSHKHKPFSYLSKHFQSAKPVFALTSESIRYIFYITQILKYFLSVAPTQYMFSSVIKIAFLHLIRLQGVYALVFIRTINISFVLIIHVLSCLYSVFPSSQQQMTEYYDKADADGCRWPSLDKIDKGQNIYY